MHHHNSAPCWKCVNPFVTGLCEGVLRSPLKGVHALSWSQRMAAIAVTIMVLLNYLAFLCVRSCFRSSPE
jgi:hypothetical protein